MNILLTAIGKRVQLIKHLKKNNYLIGTDCVDLVPSKGFVDSYYKVSSCRDKKYVDDLLQVCKKEQVDMLIPIYEPEFFILDKYREKFDEIGTLVLLSDKKILELCSNKKNTYDFFLKSKISTPKTFTKNDVHENKEYPLIIKPKEGMGSKEVFKVNNKEELEFFLGYCKDAIVQEFIEGVEYTIDILFDLKGNLISVVPRERIEVRSGEVSKSRSVRHREIIKATIDLCDKLKRLSNKLIGPINIQCIVDKNKNIKFIEINPRFGGGVPLSVASGVDYSRYLDMMMRGKDIIPIIGEFKELTMLRFDDAVYF